MASDFPILCILESRPEDAILSSGLLRKLHEEIPQATFTLVGSDASAPLFRDMPNLEDLLVIEGDGSGERFKLWNRVRERKWGLVVDLRGANFSGWLSRRKRAERKPWPKGEPIPHKVIQAAHVLQVQDDPPGPWLYTDAETEAEVDAFLEAHAKPGDGPILAIGPGSDWIGKTWQAERFAKVAGTLLGPDGPMSDGRLLIVGADDDREAVHSIRVTVSRERVIEAQGKLDRLQTCALLKRCRFYVGNDSIWTHLATAAGIPVLGVFGPSDETLEGPWGPGRMAVRGPKSMDDFRRHDPKLNQTINHMYDVPIDTVVAAALKLYAETEPGAVTAPAPVAEAAEADSAEAEDLEAAAVEAEDVAPEIETEDADPGA